MYCYIYLFHSLHTQVYVPAVFSMLQAGFSTTPGAASVECTFVTAVSAVNATLWVAKGVGSKPCPADDCAALLGAD